MSQNNYYCPYTQNQKFESFVKSLIKIHVDAETTCSEIVNYVKMIETFYTDKFQGYKAKVEEADRRLKRVKNQNVLKVEKQRELQEVFMDCVEQVK